MAVQYYDGSTHLIENQTYTVRLNIPGVEPYTLTFTSRYEPLYVSAKVIYNDTGGLLDGVKPDAVNFAIWMSGKDTEDLLVRRGLVLPNNDPVQQRAQIKAFLERSDNALLRYAFTQVVRYRANLALITAAYLTQVGNSGQLQKRLGDLSVLRETRAANLHEMLGTFRDELELWESRLVSTRNPVLGAVRAGSSYPYPLQPRRSF